MSEKTFAISVMQKLKHLGFICTRLESHDTSLGIPDLFVMGYGDSFFIEFKNEPKVSINDKQITVHWRPGQQSWMMEYCIKHIIKMHKCVQSKHCWTIVCCKDGILAIAMYKHFKDNKTATDDEAVFKFESIKSFDIKELLLSQTYRITGKYAVDIMQRYLYLFDAADAETIISSDNMSSRQIAADAYSIAESWKVNVAPYYLKQF